MFNSGDSTITPIVVLLSVVAAAIPTFLFVAVIYWVDRYEKEPTWLLGAAFVWGALPGLVLAFVVNTLFSIPPMLLFGQATAELIGATLVAPLVEESIKALALIGIVLLWHHELDSPLDGIIYGAMVGMGFAMIENVYYFLTVYADGGLQAWGVNVFLRAIVFGLNHALFTSMTGLGIALARLSPYLIVRVVAPILGWLTAVFLHAIHNLAASLGGVFLLVALVNAWGGVLLTVLIVIWALVQERRWIKRYLAEEVERGTITSAQYRIAHSGLKRFAHSLSLLMVHGPAGYANASRFYYRCSELAYKKHHLATLQDTGADQAAESLRADIARLSKLVT